MSERMRRANDRYLVNLPLWPCSIVPETIDGLFSEITMMSECCGLDPKEGYRNSDPSGLAFHGGG